MTVGVDIFVASGIFLQTGYQLHYYYIMNCITNKLPHIVLCCLQERNVLHVTPYIICTPTSLKKRQISAPLLQVNSPS